MTQEVEILNGTMPRVAGHEQGNLVELGTMLREMGLGALEARGVIEEIQALSNSMVLAAVPKIMARVQAAHRERMATLAHRVRAQNSLAGWVHRDGVLALIAQTMMETPRTGL